MSQFQREPQLTLFYDARCPLCNKEMQHLRRLDEHQSILMIDLHSDQFEAYKTTVDFHQAMAKLHGFDRNGALLLGLDVTYEAWRLVGRGFWFRPIKWRWLRPLLDFAYHFFAKHRGQISRLIMGKQNCESCQLPRKSK